MLFNGRALIITFSRTQVRIAEIERLQSLFKMSMVRGDQIEVCKIMHGYEGLEGLNKDMFFRIKNDSRTRGHSLALIKCHSRLDIKKYTFSQRVVNDWNKLPEECINATSVNMFKNRIDRYFVKTRREKVVDRVVKSKVNC